MIIIAYKSGYYIGFMRGLMIGDANRRYQDDIYRELD